MSTKFLVLIPVYRDFQPDDAAIKRLIDYLVQKGIASKKQEFLDGQCSLAPGPFYHDFIAPSIKEIYDFEWNEIILQRFLDKPEFFFDYSASVCAKCPSCRLDVESIGEIVGLAPISGKWIYTCPNCRTSTDLNNLYYEPTAGFAHFQIRFVNAPSSKLEPNILKEIESIVGCKLLVIFGRLS